MFVADFRAALVALLFLPGCVALCWFAVTANKSDLRKMETAAQAR